MNAIEYVTQEAFSLGYCGKLKWSDEHKALVPTPGNFNFMQGRIFTDDDPFDARERYSGILADEIAICADELEKRLISNSIKYLADWSIDLTQYDACVEFDDVTCNIILTHKKNRCNIVLGDTYFSNTGEILQTIISF